MFYTTASKVLIYDIGTGSKTADKYSTWEKKILSSELTPIKCDSLYAE